jgi:LDH2 family malate/lactate/ureidoglycolate dehydrogenase
MGGPRGFGLSFVCSVLAGALAGGRLPIRKKRSASAEDSQHFFQAIDPAAFADPAKFAKELAVSMDEIRGLPVAGGAESLRFPGEEDERRAARIQSEGIPLAAGVFEQLGKAAPGGWKGAAGSSTGGGA